MSVLAKIIARKNEAAIKAKQAEKPSSASTATTSHTHDQFSPCPTCHSAIRWLNAAGVSRCIGCQPPKFAALVRRKEVLAIRDQSTGERAWESLIEAPDGRLLSESGIRELAETGGLPEAWRGIEPHSLTKANAGGARVGGHKGGGVGGDGVAGDENFSFSFDRWKEIDPDEFFKAKGKTR